MSNSAERIISKFGGQTQLAKVVGRGQSTIAYWAKTGVIPGKWHKPLLEIARAKQINLHPMDFMPSEDSIHAVAGDLSPSVEVKPGLPVARYQGYLEFGDIEVSCYVLDNNERVISRTGATDVLTRKQGGGNLESYISVQALLKYIPEDLPGQMIEFSLEHVTNKVVRGMRAETFLQVCTAYVNAFRDDALTTDRQKQIGLQAAFILASCAKIGLIALIDEATGFQYDREEDALRFKMKLFMEEEMRKWEKTFPDELWAEFGRITQWKGNAHQRPKYWGKLVNELVYSYLDRDVFDWLKENVPKPKHGQNYHQWLSSQYGLERLMRHIWMLIGVSTTCKSMAQLRRKMAERYGRQSVQTTIYFGDDFSD